MFPVLSVRTNTTIQVLGRWPAWESSDAAASGAMVEDSRGGCAVRMASIEQPVQSLSGGNQQKVSLTRPFLRGDVKVILAEEPTQGVDVGARFDIYEALRAKADEGVGAIVKSSDPLELAGLCDRVIVMSRGTHRRGDPARRARGAPNRRGDRRSRVVAKAGPRRKGGA